MRCIGTLEFVSDFYNKCHQTQQFLLNKERFQKLTKTESKLDFESDKENTLPLSHVETKGTVSSMPVRPTRKSSRMENKLKKIQYKDHVSDETEICELSDIEHSNENREMLSSRAERPDVTKHYSIESKGNVIQGCKTVLSQRGSLASTEIQESNNRGAHRKASITRLRRRKKGRTVGSSTIIKSKTNKTAHRTSCLISEKNVVIENSTTDRERIDKRENSGHLSKDEKWKTYQNLHGRFLSTVEVGIETSKKVLPRLSKKENLDSENILIQAAVLVKADSLGRTASDGILQTEGPLREVSTESTSKSPLPGDEAGRARDREGSEIEEQSVDESSKIIGIEDDRIGTKSLPKVSLIRKSVIESMKNGKTFGVNTECDLVNKSKNSARPTLSNDIATGQGNKVKLSQVPGEFSGITSEKLDGNKGGRFGNFRERRRKFEGQFGKLSELITDEQKEIIETLYTINMGVVNDEEVYRNIKILDKVKVKCEICGKTYPRMDKCQVHVWSHLNMKPYCCKSCDFVTLTVSNIRCHIRKRHLKIKPFECNLCEKTYGTAVLLEEHINSHTGAKPYKCKLCDFATSNRQVLSYHKTTHKPVKDISCEVCGKKFFSNCRMRSHMIVHNKNKSLMCKLCSSYLCNAEALEKHCQKVHSCDYVCNICGIRTRSRKALTNHENVHSEAKYRCPLCSKVYKSKHMLKEHLLKHQGIRKYKCELCQKSFAQQSHIAAHMNVHMGKRYPCPGCDKLFNRRDNMRIHTRRCKIFKSNPEAKNLWIGRSSVTVSDPTPAPAVLTESTENPKNDIEKVETGLGLIRMNLLTGKTDFSNSHKLKAGVRESRIGRDLLRGEGFDEFKSRNGEVLRIGEVDIFPLSDKNVVCIQTEGDTVITENVLEPEYF